MAPEIGPGVLVWRDILHDGPVPADLDADALARVRARHLAARGWATESGALADLRARDARLAATPSDGEIVLWFDEDLFDALQLAQIDDRLAGRPGPVWRVRVPYDRRGVDLHALPREPHHPDGAAFAALRSPDPSAWLAVPAFARLLEELPDPATGLGRLERAIIAALRDGPLTAHELFGAAVAQEDEPWAGDTYVWLLADELAPLVERRDGRYALVAEPPREPPERWLGGVRLPGWGFDRRSGSVLRTS